MRRPHVLPGAQLPPRVGLHRREGGGERHRQHDQRRDESVVGAEAQGPRRRPLGGDVVLDVIVAAGSCMRRRDVAADDPGTIDASRIPRVRSAKRAGCKRPLWRIVFGWGWALQKCVCAASSVSRHRRAARQLTDRGADASDTAPCARCRARVAAASTLPPWSRSATLIISHSMRSSVGISCSVSDTAMCLAVVRSDGENRQGARGSRAAIVAGADDRSRARRARPCGASRSAAGGRCRATRRASRCSMVSSATRRWPFWNSSCGAARRIG